jgi:mandelamide amidase
LQRAGVELVEADIDGLTELNQKTGSPLVIYESRKLLVDYLAEYLPGTSLADLVEQVASPDVKSVMELVQAGATSEADYRAALTDFRPQLQRAYQDYFRNNQLDGMIYPTTRLTAKPIASSIDTVELNGKQVPTFASYIQNTGPSSNAGIPGLTLPIGAAAICDW